MTPPTAVVLERYVVERELARGGLGVVYAAREVSSGRRVAVKRLLPDVGKNPSAVRLFEGWQESLPAAIPFGNEFSHGQMSASCRPGVASSSAGNGAFFG